MIGLRTWAILNIIPANRKTTMPTSVLKIQKTSGGFGNLYINDWKEKRKRIRMSILYLLFYDLYGLDRDPT